MKLAPRLTLKWLIVFIVGAAAGMVAMRMNSWESLHKAQMAKFASRGLAPVPPGFFDIAPLATKEPSGPAVIQPGQILSVEVLEALPGRPITGERVVLPDGTINLGFYGDVQVAGLNRSQIKVKVIEHLRKYINDETLGLVRETNDRTRVAIKPVDSDRIFVDESSNYIQPISKGLNDFKILSGRIDELNTKFDRVLKELEDLRKERSPANAPDPTPSSALPPSPAVKGPGY